MSGPSPSAIARLAALAAVLAALLAAGSARACDLTIVRKPGEVVLRYDPFDSQNAPAEIALGIRNRGPEPCTFDIAFVDKDRRAQRRMALASSGLEVEVRAAGGSAASLTEAAEPGVWRGAAPGGGDEREYRFTVVAVNDAVPPAGRLEAQLGLELREPGAAAAMETAPLLLAVESPPRAQLNIAGATGHFGSAPTISTIDLGVLAPGARKRVFLQLRSNVAVSRLTIRSENRGMLMPEGEAANAGGAGVPYHIALEEEPIDLRELVERRVAAPLSLAGRSLPFEIVVDEFDNRPAGGYSDVLTIEVSPL